MGSRLVSAAGYDVWYGEGVSQHHSSRRKQAENRIEHVVFLWTALFFVRMSGVQPFQFEPTYPAGEEPDDSEEASDESDSELEESKNRKHRLLHL